MNKTRLDYSLLSKYRSLLMGLAIIFIMFCHLDVAQSRNQVAITGIAKALHIFTVGVDIFLFLSGMGLYFSYTKRKQPYLKFEKKRMLRVLPAYFVIGGATYMIYDLLLQHLSLGKFINDLFFITWLKGESSRYWYIFTIIVFYLLFPMIYRFIHGKDGKNGLIKTVVFSVFWWIVIEVLTGRFNTIDMFRIALERLPIFMIGVYAGRLVYERKIMRPRVLLLLILIGYIAFIVLKIPIIKSISNYLYYPVRGLLAISIMTTVILIMETIGKRRTWTLFMELLSWFGAMSLELYLLHQSYMILFEFPYKLTTYPVAAFVLPTITAFVIYIVRNNTRKGQTV